jgi:hypothetical protein
MAVRQVERRVAGSFNPRDLACITAAFAAASQGAAVAAPPASANATAAANAAAAAPGEAAPGEAGDDATRRVLGRIAVEALECEAGIDRFDPQVSRPGTRSHPAPPPGPGGPDSLACLLRLAYEAHVPTAWRPTGCGASC